MSRFVSCFTLCALILVTLSQKAPPLWPAQYTVTGIFNIPYWNISEPIIAYFDATNNRQRFDYYGGMDTYIWRWDLQSLYEVIPRINQQVCYVTSQIGTGPLVQILPNLVNWTYSGVSTVRGLGCDSWQQNVTNFNKTAVYTFFADQHSGQPVRLVMNGYDFVFGSHPDIYIMDYDEYQPNTVDAVVFEKPDLCNSNNTRQSKTNIYRAKAMLGKLAAVTTPVQAQDEFEAFAAFHKKFYHHEEREMRRNIYKNNMKLISKHNAKNTFQLAPNQFSDMTEEEVQMLMRPKVDRSQVTRLSSATFTHQRSGKALPDYVNWVEKGAVNPPKDQGVCGSCWTFGTAGSVEGAWFLKTGTLLSLSEQQIMDCAWGPWGSGNSACDGGFAGPAMQWITNNGGMALESSYPYLMVDAYCFAGDVSSGVVLKGYVNVTGTEADLQDAVANYGPVAVAIDASHAEFTYYSSGVYYQSNCGNTADQLDHEVLVVGYGTENGQDYWLVKNSWSTHWGDKGFVKMARNRNNNCGIATQPNYPLV